MTAAAPLVSIVTPSFNQAAFLEATIQSVLQQNYPNLEYIIIDGGSTDGSVEIIRRYADRLAYWVTERDAGQTQAINKGMQRAHGDILTWVNSDDLCAPGAVSAAVEALQRNPELGLVYANCDYIDSDGQLLQTMHAWDYVPRRLLTGIPIVIQPASFFTRQAWETAQRLDEKLQYVFDHDFYVRLTLAGLKFQKVEKVWASFRLHSASKTVTQWIGFNLELQQIIERTIAAANPIFDPAWKNEARANAWQWLGEAYLLNGRKGEAAKAFRQAITACPWRPKTLMAMAFLVDTYLGTHLTQTMRRWRYRLPDAPAGSNPLTT